MKQKHTKKQRTFCSHIFLIAILCMFWSVTYSQTKTVTGIVKDKAGEPVPGASVKEKGKATGVTTDINGKFSITVSDNAILVIRFIGFKENEVAVGNSNSLNVTLAEATEELKEIVVVGFGTQKKETVVGAISQITSKDLLKSATPNISQAIVGTVPGLITSQATGAPGADDVQIFIRGRASFAGDNQPLVMVDNVERPFSQISPNDIETISVLKDASLTAPYGVRGANGVILITTKRGKLGKPQVGFRANFQTQAPTRKDTYLDSYNSVVLLEEALKNDGLSSQFSASDIEMFRRSVNQELSPLESQLYPNVDWYDAILKSSSNAADYSLDVTGGTSRMKYFTSLNYYDQPGLYRNVSTYEYDRSSNSRYKRYGFRANLDFALNKRFDLLINFHTRFEERTGPNIGNENTTSSNPWNELFYEINHTPGWLFPVQYENGFYGGNSQNQNNIVARLANGGFYQRTNTINEVSFNGKHKLDFITQGLSVNGLATFDYTTYYNRRFTSGFATYELIDRSNPGLESSYTRYNEDSELTYAGNTQTTTMKIDLQGSLEYNRSFFGKHNVEGRLTYTQNDLRIQADLARRYQGLNGRVAYNFRQLYFLELNGAYNGSENFAKGRRFGFFPAISGGWMLSNASFMENTKDWLKSFKVKASYGEVGNDRYIVNGADVRFLYVPTWIQLANAYLFGDTNYQMGVYEGRYPNTTVTWERAKKYNVGVESNFLNGAYTFNFDVFKEDRSYILTDYLSKANWTGQSMAPGNLGVTTNQGYEIELRHNRTLGKVNVNIGGFYTHAKNKIKNMDEPAGMTGYRKREGNAIGQYFGLIADGFVTSSDLSSGNLPVSTFGTVMVGDLKYRDLNNDGYIDERDQTVIGYSNVPENSFSIILGASWKSFSASATFQGVSNVSRYYDAEAMFAFVNGGKVKDHHLNRWNPALPEAENLASASYPLLHYDQNGDHNQRLNSFFLKDGSFMRLRNVAFSYSLPQNISKRLLMSNLQFNVNANNLITWDKLDGLTDPESNGSNNYPIVKTINFGVSARF